MILTHAGERLLSSAQSVLSEMKRAEEDIRQIALKREGILRICTNAILATTGSHPLKDFQPRVSPHRGQIVVEGTLAAQA